MAANLASGIGVPLYPAETIHDVEHLREKLNIVHIFMGEEEYEESSEYIEKLAKEGVVVTVSAGWDFKLPKGSRVHVMPKPLYAYPAIKILNGEYDSIIPGEGDNLTKVDLFGLKALIVDDEPMNLIVATGIFKDYGMIIDTVGSGKEAIQKFRTGDYDVIFMDHMMPEMDGVEAMKQIRVLAKDMDRKIIVIVLTANAVSGAKEMFMREGFDGFIAKPINTSDFERVMQRVLAQ